MYILPEHIRTILISSTSEIPLTAREAISGALGSISIACWVFLLLPQVIENYRNKSAEAISFAFIVIWAVGDIANLLGSIWASLIPTTIATAIWFCIQDAVLITQCLYYSIRTRRMQGKSWLEAARASVSGDMDGDAAEAVHRVRQEQLNQRRQNDAAEDEEQVSEEEPLLKRTASNVGGKRRVTFSEVDSEEPAQRRMSRNEAIHHARRVSNASGNHVVKFIDRQATVKGWRLVLRNALAIVAVFGIGTLAWYASYRSGVWNPVPLDSDSGSGTDSSSSTTAKGATVLGYISALAYLGARIPQILKNYREQSCEGLSLLFFILSTCGNLTQGSSILFHSTERAYVIKNIPWLLGSLGTMAEDFTIFAQFHMYGSGKYGDETAVE